MSHSELPIVMLDEPVTTFEKMFGYVWGFFAAVGVLAAIVLIAAWFGYASESSYKQRTPAELRQALACRSEK